MNIVGYILKAHTAECVKLDGRGGDPWNIYFRMGAAWAWALSAGVSTAEEKTWDEWEVSDERKLFWDFSNRLAGKTIVEVDKTKNKD